MSSSNEEVFNEFTDRQLASILEDKCQKGIVDKSLKNRPHFYRAIDCI